VQRFVSVWKQESGPRGSSGGVYTRTFRRGFASVRPGRGRRFRVLTGRNAGKVRSVVFGLTQAEQGHRRVGAGCQLDPDGAACGWLASVHGTSSIVRKRGGQVQGWSLPAGETTPESLRALPGGPGGRPSRGWRCGPGLGRVSGRSGSIALFGVAADSPAQCASVEGGVDVPER